MKTNFLAFLPLLGVFGCDLSTYDETYKSPQGVTYKVDRVGNLTPQGLPQNSDLKMADGDLAKYAQEACGLDFRPEYAPARCDIYVQPDKAGTLIGYAVVTQTKDGSRLSTATSLNAQKQPHGSTTCGIDGLIYGSGEDYTKAAKDSSRDFEGQIRYSAWEKDPGNWLVSQVGPNDQDDRQGSLGVWYVEKQGAKLRINQERWNYCYADSGVQIDDVFTLAITLVRESG